MIKKLKYRIKERIRFWVYKHLKNGVIFLDGQMTLGEAQARIRTGGYVVLMPKWTNEKKIP